MTEPHVGRLQDARKTDGLHLSPRHREKLTALLREHLPGVEVWAYGSRVNGRSHDGSDLDLVLRGPGLQAVPPEQLGDFTDAVRESTLPFLVEARDWTRLPARFHAEVERSYVVLQHRVADEWPAVTLGDCAVINDATYSPKEAWPFIHYLDTGNVTDNRIAAIRRLVPGTDTIPSRARRKVQPGDVVYSTVRPDQRHFGLLKDPPDNLLVSTAFAVIRGKAGVAHTGFLYWFLAQRHVVERLHTIAEHSVSAYPSIRPDDLARLELRLPPLPEQRRIAHVLGTLDDKIALNATLEDMARTLFKSWFVDFDPVHAKAALKRRARPHHSPLQGGDETATVHGRPSSPSVSPSHHSPRPLSLSKGEGESARQGRSPQSSRWGVVRRGYPRHALTAARTLRRNRTDAEGLLWHYLRNKQLDGYRFRRQQPIGRYIVDFACLSRKVLIELDGGQHAEQTSRDEKRDAFLRARGYRVLRFWSTEVFENCFGVLERVWETVAGDPPHPSTGSGAGGSDETGTATWTVERARAYLDGMDPEVAALFPDGFEDSVLGQIPKGWKVKTLPEVIEINPSRTLRKGEIAPYLDMANMPTEGHVPDAVVDRPFGSGMRFMNGDTLLARITPCLENGKTAYVDFLEGGQVGWGSTEYIVLHPKPPLPDEFACCLARSIHFRDFAIQSMTGSSGRQRVPVEAFAHYVMPLPAKRIVESFGKIIRHLLIRAKDSASNSSSFIILRDTLLPKLLSGDLLVRDI